MIEKTFERIADALEKLVELNERMLGSMSSVAVEPEAPKQAAAKGGKAKAAAAPKPAEEPAPEPAAPAEEEKEEPAGEVLSVDDIKEVFLVACKADAKAANEAFDAFKAETGTTKISALDNDQRAELKTRFEAVIAAAAM